MAKPTIDEQLLPSLAEFIPAGVLVLSPAGEVVLWNRQLEQLTGLPAAEALSRPWSVLASRILPAAASLDELTLADPAAGFFALQIAGRPLQLQGEDGPVAVNALFSPVAGREGWLIGIFSPVDQEQVVVDNDLPVPSASQLEGVPNRYELSFMMPQQLAILARYNIPFTLLFLELENYQPLIDRLGLQGWKATLRAIYESLLSIVRRADFVGGYDHVTFWLLLTNADRRGSRQVAEKMRRHASKITVENLAVTLSAVVGGAVAQPDETPEQFFSRAQQALRQAHEAADGVFIAP